MKIKIPNELFGINTAEAYKRYMEERDSSQNQPQQPKPKTTPSNIQNPENYIILEGRTHGSYSYPDMLVSKERSHFEKNCFDTQKSLHQEGMQNLRENFDREYRRLTQ